MHLFHSHAPLALFFFYLYPSVYSLPAIIPESFRLTNISHLLHGKTDPPPLIYHIPNTHNTLYIQPTPVHLPPSGIAATLWSARVFVANQIAIRQGNADIPLPSDQDPGKYQPRGSVVKVSWRSSLPDKQMTWGELAATLRGLEDCIVRNQQEPFVNVWRVYGTMGELGWGRVEFGRVEKG
ncbi:MAG: hypothetical protein Q9212_002601 [Teloschistes hypoglaucus]